VHGLVVPEVLTGVTVADGDEAGLEVGVAEPVGLTVADAVGLAVAVAVAVGDGVLDGEPAGEPEAVDDGDVDGAGVQDVTGITAAADRDGLWVSAAAVLVLPVTGAALGVGCPVAVPPAIGVAVPLFALPLPVVELCPDSTVELSWTRAWRNGGTATATPAANTAQANASAGRSIRSRKSQRVRCLRARVREPAAGGWSSRDPCSPGAAAALPSAARAGPERIFVRMRSRPSGRGSTCSAAACNAERTSSAKSCG
jgi:hypothetical protein